MDDVTRAITFGLLTFLAIHGSLEQRARHGAEQQVRESFNRSGSVRAHLETRGLLGLETSDFWAVDIYGNDLKTDRLPFYVYPRPGWKGSIRHLRLHFQRFTLNGLPIHSFEADIPSATFDISHAIAQSRLVLRGTGTGPATVAIDAEGLRIFIEKKFSRIISEVSVRLPSHKVVIAGKVRLFDTPTPFTASGTLMPRAGRFIDLTDPDIHINGTLLSPQGAAALLKQINPVLDADTDVGLGGYFIMERIEIGDDDVIIRGRASIPVAPSH